MPPSNVSGTLLNTTHFSANWSIPSIDPTSVIYSHPLPATFYELQISVHANMSHATVYMYPGSARTLVVPLLDQEMVHYYRMRSYGALQVCLFHVAGAVDSIGPWLSDHKSLGLNSCS